jgi:hypothetical protein
MGLMILCPGSQAPAWEPFIATSVPKPELGNEVEFRFGNEVSGQEYIRWPMVASGALS